LLWLVDSNVLTIRHSVLLISIILDTVLSYTKVIRMVQQEVNKKTRIYGTAAVLAAMILISVILVFSSTPGLPPLANLPTASAMKTFSDETELRNYLLTNSQGTLNYAGGPLDSKFFGDSSRDGALSGAAPTMASESASQGNSYSTTNIQVAGVDEADIVKNDGNYLYVASNDYSTNQNYVYIVKADAQDPRTVARIPLDNNVYLAGMYLSQESSKLIVIGSEYQVYALDVMVPRQAMIAPYLNDVRTFVNVYDLSDKVNPVLTRNFTLSGSYFNSRMIGDYVYAVVSQPAYILDNNTLPLPTVYADTAVSEVAPSKIYYSDTANYSDIANNYFTYTTFVGLNVKDNSEKLTNMTILMGGASTMYVSLNNIYVTYPIWSEAGEYTSIYQISINKDSLAFETKGSVPGSILNQYAMDEYNENFRLATTSQKQQSSNNVYVLDMNLTVVGKLENLAMTERIYSARFVGDKAYLVTFRQTDPFFVVDLSNPKVPRIAGELKIPGYSSYLHIYDENHVIGLGMENSTVKLSLFDVTNVNSPTEIARYIVQGDYTSSDALYEPKAFLFDKAKELLVIPVSITQYGLIGEGSVVPPTDKDVAIAPLQGGYWQGAYVFKLTLTGFELKGGITHQEDTNQQNYYGDYNLNVNRALYIDNTLYTVSNGKVKLNTLTDLTQIAEINLK
jgi:inhibitor of cysteine peptidase